MNLGIKRFLQFFITLLLITGIGTWGYMSLEGWRFLDSLYMAVITLTTIGFGEVHPLSDKGRIFTLGLIIVGVGNMAYFLSSLFQLFFEWQANNFFGRRRMEKAMSKMKCHAIICGHGKMGAQICKYLHREKHPFIVIERRTEETEVFEELGYPYLIGNATDDEILLKAGIERANFLVTVVTTDPENVFITLTAKSLNHDLKIISRVFDDSTRPKLLKAGANKIICPYATASSKMAQSILRPATDDFMDFLLEDENEDWQMGEIHVRPEMNMADATLEDIKLKERGVMIVGIRKKGGRMIFAPKKKEKIEPGDRVIAVGMQKEIGHLVDTLTNQTHQS